MAFVAVAAWEAFSAAGLAVQREANFVGNRYRDTAGLPQPSRSEIREELKLYVDFVIDKEWPEQRAGHAGFHLSKQIEHLHALVAKFVPGNMGEPVVHAEILHQINNLYSARRDRWLAAGQGIPGVIWWIMILGGVLTVGFSFLFGMPSFPMHLVMTGMLAAAMGLVMVLIIALDWPFRGDLSVSTTAFELVRASMEVPAQNK